MSTTHLFALLSTLALLFMAAPASADEPHDTLCALEDDDSPVDGSCGDDGIYRNPTPDELNKYQIEKRNELLCGPDGLEDNTTVLDGHCRQDGNWVLTTNTSAILAEVGDRLAHEPHGTLCANEDNGTTLDGECNDDGTYRNPNVGDVNAFFIETRDGLFCGEDGLEDNSTHLDGQCDADGHYSIPNNLFAIVDELLSYLP